MPEMPSSAARTWSVVLILSAVALAVGSGAADNFRPARSTVIPAAEIPLPVPETPAGEIPSPPGVFRWKSGIADCDLAQVTVFRKSLEPFWYSAPTKATEIVVDPAVVFQGIPAGEPLTWRVREVRGGRPLGVSALQEFTFLVDLEGRPVGESVAGDPLHYQD